MTDIIAEILRDPYPVYEQLRSTNPIYKLETGVWLVTRYDDVSKLLVDQRLGHWWQEMETRTGKVRATQNWLAAVSAGGDSKLRGMLFSALAASLRPTVDELSEFATSLSLVEKSLKEGSTIDVVDAVCRPFASGATASLLNIPTHLRGQFIQLLTTSQEVLMASLLDDAAQDPPPLREIHELLREIREGRCGSIDDKGFMSLVAGAGLSDREQIHFLNFVMLAASDNLAGFLANCLYRLMVRERKIDRIDRQLIEELLRLDPPVQIVEATTNCAVSVRGQNLEAGATVWLALGAANRDPQVFADPDELKPERYPNPHLSFGKGAFACVGASFAYFRIELLLREVVSRLLRAPVNVISSELNVQPAIMRRISRLDVCRFPQSKVLGSDQFLRLWKGT